MRGCLAAAVLLVSAAAAPACRRTAAEMVAALDLRRLSHSPCASAVIHADERYVLKHVLTRRDSLLERETCVLQKLQRFDWAPRWFCTGDDYILTEWRGKEMCERTESYDAQMRRILDELHAAGVRHNDLRKRERTDFTVAAGRVSLVDFAYASGPESATAEPCVEEAWRTPSSFFPEGVASFDARGGSAPSPWPGSREKSDASEAFTLSRGGAGENGGFATQKRGSMTVSYTHLTLPTKA